MRLESAKYLRDMLDAGRAITDHIHGRTKDEFLNLRWLREAINWNFCVIGEAMSQLKRIDETTVERITDYWKIIGLRNQLIHGYGAINYHITWDIVQTKLPKLMSELEQLLSE